MPVRLVKCGWCPRDCWPNELRYSKKLDCMVCPDCDCDNDTTLGEIEEQKRKQARDAAWNEGCGWVKMKERPILFSGPMVRATLDGRKEQTRRVIKPQPFFNQAGYLAWKTSGCLQNMGRSAETMLATHCPYGQPGDRLRVRETWRVGAWVHPDKTPESRSGGGGIAVDYLADGFNDRDWRECENDELFYRLVEQSIIDARNSGLSPGDDNTFRWECGQSPCRWRPSIHMPRWASRITLEITGIRVERLQDISMEDAISEGVDWKRCPTYQTIESFTEQRLAQKLGMACFPILTIDYIGGYKKLWESINGPGSWDKNPHVWVVEFRRVK